MTEDERTDYENLIDSSIQLADSVSEYFKTLMEKGFSRQEALYLTTEYQKSIFGLGSPKK